MSISIQPQDGTEIWSEGGPWRFSRESVIDGAAAHVLFSLYHHAFEPLKTQAAARQVLDRDEFMTQMKDERIDKYVAWEPDSAPVGLITLTRHLEAVPWISPEYLAVRYPEQWARKAIYYLGFLLARPSTRPARFLETIVSLCISPLVSERAVIAWDVCSHNDDVLNFSERISQVVQQSSDSHVEKLDTQVYYAVNFA